MIRNYAQFAQNITDICLKRQFLVKKLKSRLQLITINPHKRSTIAIIGGLHGNEVAGPLGVLEWLKTPYIARKHRLLIIPCANPYGFINNTRRNGQNKDQNRRWCKGEIRVGEVKAIENVINNEKIDFLYTVHEDHTASKFYLYHSDQNIAIYEEIKKIAESYFPIDLSKRIRGDLAKDGIIVHDEVFEARNKIDCSIENYVYKTFGVNYLTTETPGMIDLEDRIACTVKIIDFLVKTYRVNPDQSLDQSLSLDQQ